MTAVEFHFDISEDSILVEGNVLVFHTYPNDLYTSWVFEFVSYLRKKSKKTRTVIVDLATSSWHREMTLSATLKRFLLGTKLNSNLILEYLSQKLGISMITEAKMKVISKEIFSICTKILSSKSASEWLEYEDLPLALRRSVHSSMSNKQGTLYYQPRFHLMGMLLRSMSYYSNFYSARDIINKLSPSYVVVCNSRLPNSAAIVEAAKDSQTKVIFLERGGTPGLFNVFNHSPHALRARSQACENLWAVSSKIAPDETKLISQTYIEFRRKIDPHSGKSWNMNSKLSSYVDEVKGKGYSRVCLFYTTTELEVAVYGDERAESDFESQSDALKALEEVLSDDWAIIVRRHPAKNRPMRKDPERESWQGIISSRIFWIAPNSREDSYELASKANLVCHWDSSIGAEITYLQKVPVLTMGPNFWNGNEHHNVRNRLQLAEVISKHIGLTPIESALRWGLYSAIAGKPFEQIVWKSGHGYLWNTKMHSAAMRKKLLKKKS